MNNKIKINSELRFGFEDLLKEVDFSEKFTLRDVLVACHGSVIAMNTLQDILRCSYIEDYYYEACKKSYKEKNIEYLEVYWWGTIEEYDGVISSGNVWGFHGIGRKGKIAEDVRKYCKLTKKEKENYREKYAVEMSPIYKIADLPIRMAENILITDYKKMNKKNSGDGLIKFTPTITLIEFLYAIFHELSFCGSIEQRESFVEELNSRCKEIDKWKKEGTLDQHTKPWKKIIVDLKKKIKTRR